MSPTPHDPLLQRYQEANALDEARPSDGLRKAVLAHAESQANTVQPTARLMPKRPAANDRLWAWRAFGSLAVLGFVGLLVMQFERGTPEEQKVALGAPDPRADVDANAAAPQANSKALTVPPAGELANREATNRATAVAPSVSVPKPPVIAEGETLASAASAPALPPAAPMVKARSSAPALNEPQQTEQSQSADENQIAGRAVDRQNTAIGFQQAKLPALHAAVANGDLASVQNLLNQGASVNARDNLGRTALMLAAMGQQQNMVVVLMDAGANAALVDQAQLSAADHALRAGHADWLPSLQPRR